MEVVEEVDVTEKEKVEVGEALEDPEALPVACAESETLGEEVDEGVGFKIELPLGVKVTQAEEVALGVAEPV